MINVYLSLLVNFTTLCGSAIVAELLCGLVVPGLPNSLNSVTKGLLDWLWYLQYSAVKGVSSLPLVTYCCSISYGTLDLFFLLTKGNLSLRLVPVVLAHLLFRLRCVPG